MILNKPTIYSTLYLTETEFFLANIIRSSSVDLPLPRLNRFLVKPVEPYPGRTPVVRKSDSFEKNSDRNAPTAGAVTRDDDWRVSATDHQDKSFHGRRNAE